MVVPAPGGGGGPAPGGGGEGGGPPGGAGAEGALRRGQWPQNNGDFLNRYRRSWEEVARHRPRGTTPRGRGRTRPPEPSSIGWLMPQVPQ